MEAGGKETLKTFDGTADLRSPDGTEVRVCYQDYCKERAKVGRSSSNHGVTSGNCNTVALSDAKVTLCLPLVAEV